MIKSKLPQDWPHHLFPLTVALIALIVMILAPIWAVSWSQIPFIGVFIEPNNVVSLVEGSEWPAKLAGVEGYDQILSIENTPINNVRQMGDLLKAIGFDTRLTIDFQTREGASDWARVTPREFRLGELLNWFIVPYAVGLAFLGIGLWAYRLGKDQGSARAFLTFTAAMSITTGAYFDMNTSHNFILGWAFSVPIAASALTHLALVFPRPMPFVRRTPILRFLPWAVTVLFWIPIARSIINPATPWDYIPNWLGSYGYSAIAILLFLGSLLLRTFKSTSPMIRQQSRIIIFGAALAFGPILFLFLLPSATGQLVSFKLQEMLLFGFIAVFSALFLFGIFNSIYKKVLTRIRATVGGTKKKK